MLWPAAQVTARRVILGAATVLSLATLGTSVPSSHSPHPPLPPCVLSPLAARGTMLTANPAPTDPQH